MSACLGKSPLGGSCLQIRAYTCIPDYYIYPISPSETIKSSLCRPSKVFEMTQRLGSPSVHEDDGDHFIDENDAVEIIIDEGGDYPLDGDDQQDEGEHIDDKGGGMEEDEVVVEDTSILRFGAHSKSVFAIAAHPTQPLAASGGEDDMGYLWDLTTGEKIQALGGHSDSVNCVAFSSDGDLVATGGMDGKTRVWKRTGDGWKNWEFLIELLGPDELIWLKWHPKGNVLIGGANDSTVWMWQLPSGQTMQVFSGHAGPVQAGMFTPDGKRLLTASADGSLIVWDPRSASPIRKLSATDARFGMESGITSLAVNPAGTVAVVGGANGEVRVINLSNGEVLGKLEGHGEGESIEAIEFMELGGGSTNAGVVVTGGTDGKACIWDLTTMRLRVSVAHSDAITTLVSHNAPKAHLITTASADRSLKTWDARSGLLLREHTGHHGLINSAAVGRGAGGKDVLLSAGDEGVCLVYDVE